MGWNYLSIPKLQWLPSWSLGMDEWFHPAHQNGWNHLSILGLKLIQLSKWAPCRVLNIYIFISIFICSMSVILWIGHTELKDWMTFIYIIWIDIYTLVDKKQVAFLFKPRKVIFFLFFFLYVKITAIWFFKLKKKNFVVRLFDEYLWHAFDIYLSMEIKTKNYFCIS